MATQFYVTRWVCGSRCNVPKAVLQWPAKPRHNAQSDNSVTVKPKKYNTTKNKEKYEIPITTAVQDNKKSQ
eukprot:3193288-Amphidinium_carterae.2